MRATKSMLRGIALFGLGLMLGIGASLAAPAKAAAVAQQTTQPRQPQMPGGAQSGTGVGTNPNVEPPDPLADKMEAGRARALADDRHKKMVSDTDKLLQLATELKSEVDKSTKDEMSITVIRKAADIEKLAHDVKERMKG